MPEIRPPFQPDREPSEVGEGSPCSSHELYARAEHSLRERVKELRCLYAISEIAARPELPLDAAIQAIADAIPPAWQYPDITSSRIVVADVVYRTTNYAPSSYRQTQPITVSGEQIGFVEVVYAEASPLEDEGPFLREERSLLNAIALRIGDIVDRRRSREALDEENAKNRALLAAIPDLIFQVDREGVLVSYHAGTYSGVEPNLDRLIGRSVFDEFYQNILPRSKVEQGMCCVRHVLTTGHPHAFEQHVFVAGQERDFEVRLVPATRFTVLGMVRDITDRRRLEKEILEISGREQRRIGHDLHDGLCQHLAGIGFLARAMATRPPTNVEEVARDAREIQRQVDDTLTLTRRIARGLNPVQLETEGLLPALKDLAEQTTAVFRLPCTFVHEGERPAAGPDIGLNLYRIAQEAINNVVKHAHAHRVRIGLKTADDRIRLTIEDDGVGLRHPSHPPLGMGFNIMRYRAMVIGGSLSVQPAPTGGTLVCCAIPAPVALPGSVA